MSQQIEIVADEKNRCGEGPIWDFRHNETFIWNDLSSSLVFENDPATGLTSIISRGIMAAGITLNGEKDFVFAGANGIGVWKRDGSFHVLATEHEGEALAFNDIVAGPHGRVYAGTKYWGEGGMEKLGKLYRFDRDGNITVVDEGIEMSNGLAFSPDARTLYYADTARRIIYAYDVDDGSGNLSNRRVFVTVPGDEGIPDGHTVDAEGYLWSAQWYGSQIVRYDPDGDVERRIEIPAKQVSSVAFGGPDLTELYVTTAGKSKVGPLTPPGYDDASGYIGGALYRLHPGVQGRREHISALGL
jgi:D-xylonolactonase